MKQSFFQSTASRCNLTEDGKTKTQLLRRWILFEPVPIGLCSTPKLCSTGTRYNLGISIKKFRCPSFNGSFKNKIFTEQSLLEQSLLEQRLLEQSLLEQNLLEQSLLEQSLLEQSLLEQTLLEQSLLEQSLLEQNALVSPTSTSFQNREKVCKVDAIKLEI
jgi:hypothetical protein